MEVDSSTLLPSSGSLAMIPSSEDKDWLWRVAKGPYETVRLGNEKVIGIQ